MANLKAIAMRLKSVKNIQKITQSMKMVSAAKYARAEKDLKAARPYGNGAQAFYTSAEVYKQYTNLWNSCVFNQACLNAYCYIYRNFRYFGI